ncbi:MAG: hypothetical protein LPK85_06860 [Gammaproteobacteria bacterium]|nr:hypothetical protein [Gammaproteobacteria bacterium]
MQLYVVSSPLQLFNALEARERFHAGQVNRLLYLYRKPIDRAQAEVLVDAGWNSVHYLRLNSLLRLFYPIWFAIWRWRWARHVRRVYLGYLPNLRAHIANTLRAEVWVVDDGHLSVAQNAGIADGSLRSRVSLADRLLGRKTGLGYLTRAHVFSAYPSAGLDPARYTFNDYACFRRRTAHLPTRPGCVFIGTPLQDILSHADQVYPDLLAQICDHYAGQRVCYAAHRYEDLEVVRAACRGLPVDVVRFDTLIEWQFAKDGACPEEISTLLSSAIDTLSLLYPVRARLFVLPDAWIRADKRDICHHIARQAHASGVLLTPLTASA